MLGDLGKLFVAKGLKKLPKVQKIARSGHTDCVYFSILIFCCFAAINLFILARIDSLIRGLSLGKI